MSEDKNEGPKRESLTSNPSLTTCPFARMDETSQVIRRRDLLELGTSFRESLTPLKDLVEYMRRQVASVDRLQSWLFVLVGLATVGMVLHFMALMAVYNTSRDLEQTVNKIDQLEQRVNNVNTSANRAASAAEAAQKDTRAIASAQASAPLVELIPEPDPVRARSAPVILRVSSPKAVGASSAAPAASVTVQMGPR